jgi:hypothetical protein
MNSSSSDIQFRHLCGRLHALGPRPMFELLREIAAGKDLLDRLPIYAAMDGYTVRLLGADKMPPLPLTLIGGST